MKDDLRYKYKILRKYFQGVRREEADRAILECFCAAYGNYESYFIYNSVGTEADTKGIIEWLISQNKRVYLPRVQGKDIVPVPYGKTVKGAFGIQEPQGEPYVGDIDVTIVPLLAVNEDGYRLGYGGGYYDRYLKGANTLSVGLGYGIQLCSDLQQDVWDEPLKEFICERGVYSFGRQ
ncbi:MAG: 5-formyltetrahydrofolate cyclo-ligase [Clostridia bacterium]|nr:5-formyltetrahydrofolate cyclo-ligase [Clostridia bacterium]